MEAVPKKALIVVETSSRAQECEIRNFNHFKDSLHISKRHYLPTFVVDGEPWCFFVQLSTDCSLGFYLDRLKKGLSPLRVKFAITIVNKEHHNKTIFRETSTIFEDLGWGWSNLINLKKDATSGFVVNDTLVFQTCMRIMKEPSCPEPDNRPLLTKSEEFLLALLKGKNTTDPDVMLKLEDDLLPGHRFLLSASSEYFRAMFKSGMSESTSDIVEIQDVAIEDMKVIINFIYGVLEATPDSDEWLHSLTLAIDRLGLQANGLMEHCVAGLTSRLSLKNFTETLVVANRVNHHGLKSTCAEFANRKENRSTFRKNEALKCAVKDPDLAFDLICDTLERQRQDQEQLEPLMHVYNAPLHGSSSNKYSMPERRAVSKPKICLAMSSFLELRDPVVLPPWTPWLRFSMPMKAPRRQF